MQVLNLTHLNTILYQFTPVIVITLQDITKNILKNASKHVQIQ